MALFGDKKKDRKQKRRFLETPEINAKGSTTTVLARELRLEEDLTVTGDAVVAGSREVHRQVRPRRRNDRLGGVLPMGCPAIHGHGREQRVLL